MNFSRRISWVLRTLVAVSILGLLLFLIGRQDFGQALSRVSWPWLIPIYLTAAATVLVNASLLRFMLRITGLKVGLQRVVLAKTLGTFYALILPGDLVAGVAKWADLSAATGDRSRVLSAMVLTKIALAVPPLLIGSITLLISNPLPTQFLTVAAAATAVVVIFVTALLLNPVTGPHLDTVLNSILRRGPDFLRRPSQQLFASLDDFRRIRLWHYVSALGRSLMVFGLAILGMLLATIAADVTVPLTALFWINLILFVSRLVPIAAGNLGVREGILVVTFGLYGVDAAAAVLIGLIMFSNIIIVGVLGALYQIAIAFGLAGGQVREANQ